MNRNLTPSRHYRVEVTGDESRAIVNLDTLADALPHGSGIDGDWYLTVRRNGDIGIQGEYHHMNEHGFYNGWSNFRFAIVREPRDKGHKLYGLCEGQVQITARKGDIVMRPVRGGRDESEYLHDVCSSALSDAGLVTELQHIIVPVADAPWAE